MDDTIEIVGGEGLDKAFKNLNINAQQKYKSQQLTPPIEVWKLSKVEYERLCSVDDKDWKEDWGWWRAGRCIFEGMIGDKYCINNQTMLGYPDQRIDAALIEMDKDNPDDVEYTNSIVNDYKNEQFSSFVKWLSETQNVSAYYNIVYFATSLATDNNMTLSEFFKAYQP